MYLVTIQPKKQGEFEAEQIICSADDLSSLLSNRLKNCNSCIAIIAFVELY